MSCLCCVRMTEILTSRIQLYKEDFEVEAAKVGTKIQTYFAQLIEVIKYRQNYLISELDAILSSYRLERDRIEDLERLRSVERENSKAPDVDEAQYEIIDNIESELGELQQKISRFVEFEWNRKYAREASAIGKLSVKSLVTLSAETPEGSIPEESKFGFTPERKPRVYPQNEDSEIGLRPTLEVGEPSVFSTDRASYKRPVDLTPERIRRVHIDDYTTPLKGSPTKRLCLEGNSVPRYRADSTEHVDTAAQVTKFDL